MKNVIYPFRTPTSPSQILCCTKLMIPKQDNPHFRLCASSHTQRKKQLKIKAWRFLPYRLTDSMEQVFAWGVKSMKSYFLSGTIQKFIPWIDKGMSFRGNTKNWPTTALLSPQQLSQFYSSLFPLQQTILPCPGKGNPSHLFIYTLSRGTGNCKFSKRGLRTMEMQLKTPPLFFLQI